MHAYVIVPARQLVETNLTLTIVSFCILWACALVSRFGFIPLSSHSRLIVAGLQLIVLNCFVSSLVFVLIVLSITS